jgi:hypothetical protein
MNRTSGMFLALLVLGLCRGGSAGGAEPDNSSWSWFSWFHSPRCPSCPDDYCPKKLPPCLPCVTSQAPDDYGPKKLPCVTGVKCSGKDDYSREPWRVCLPPCAPFWYIGGSQGTCRNPLEPPLP